MAKNPYRLKHIRCSMKDFYSDAHRFSFVYEGKEYHAYCYQTLFIDFVDPVDGKSVEFPENVMWDLIQIIWKKIDDDGDKWRYPQKAYEIADEYCKEEFE